VIRARDRELERELRELRAPAEAEAEERSWPVVREAYERRTPIRPSRHQRQLALAVAGGLAVIAVGLSPAGAEVGELVSDVVGVSDEQAKPELRSLPAAGELLVESEAGTWIVRDDGSKRLLGDFAEAAWSPNGLYVVVADGASLVAVEPQGEVRWSITTAGPPSDLTWEGADLNTRIAYRAAGDLYVVAGDGTGEHLVASDVGPGAPQWIALPGVTKVDPEGGGPFPYLLAYPGSDGRVHAVDPDSGAPMSVRLRAVDRQRLHGQKVPSPILGSGRVARATNAPTRSSVIVSEDGRRRVVFSGPGSITHPVWSPDGRWLLFGWREADQWVFVQPDRPRRVIAIDDVSEQFAGGDGAAGFPRPGDWILPSR
jgi:hypothetical protein